MKRDPNLWMVERIALALGLLREQVVFLGGAAAGLLLTDPAAPSIRITKDVDVIVEVGGRGDYRAIEKLLEEQKFLHDISEGAPICRWCLDELRLDVMPTNPEILGFSNRWYPDAIRTSHFVQLPNGLQIRLVSPPCFLATKMEAFLGRGGGDYLGSHDLEDFISIVDGRAKILEEVRSSDPLLRSYLKEKLQPLLSDEQFHYALQGHLPGDTGSQARLPWLLKQLQALTER